MKYDSGNAYGDNKKYYRDCALIDMKTFLITEEGDEIINEENLPENTIYCDLAIADIIAYLNKKGYKTLYSCEGHMDEKAVNGNNILDKMYIVMTADNIGRYIKNLLNLPRNFMFEISHSVSDFNEEIKKTYTTHEPLNIKDKVITIYCNAFYWFLDDEDVNGLTKEKFDYYSTKDRMALREWVKTLPDLNDPEVENALYDERIIDRETARQCGFDFESVQEYAADIGKSYDLLVGAMKDMYESMSVAMDTYKYISLKLQSLRLVDDITSIDGEDVIDYSKLSPTEHLELYEEVHKLNEQKENINKIKKSFKEKAKYAAPISPEEIKNIGEKYADTTVNIKELVNKAYEESYENRRKESLDSIYGFMNNKTN